MSRVELRTLKTGEGSFGLHWEEFCTSPTNSLEINRNFVLYGDAVYGCDYKRWLVDSQSRAVGYSSGAEHLASVIDFPCSSLDISCSLFCFSFSFFCLITISFSILFYSYVLLIIFSFTFLSFILIMVLGRIGSYRPTLEHVM